MDYAKRYGVNLKAFFIVSGTAAFLFLACSKTNSQLGSSADKATVFVEKAQKKMFQKEILYPARVLSEVLATVKAPSAGRIVKVHRHVGDEVKRGSPLVELKNLDAGFDFSKVVVRAPVAGRVWQLEVSEGSELAMGDKVASVIDPKKLEVRVEVPAADLKDLEEALETQLFFKGSSEGIRLRKAHLSPMVDLQTGTSTCVLKLEDKDAEKVVPGQIVSIKILGPKREFIAVAQENLVYRLGVPHVKTLEDRRIVRMRSVKLGEAHGHLVEVLSGLSEGDELIVRTTKYVADGEEVQLFEEASEEKSLAR